ncbi:MAG: dioxygenase [Chloroflexi bacterium]|nr:dioxygenase [Chloroflexota bacterium]
MKNRYTNLARHILSRAILFSVLTLLLAACAGQPTSAPAPQATAIVQPTSVPAPQATATTRPTNAPSTAAPAATQPAPTQSSAARDVVPTPVCRGTLEATPAQTEGPYYKQNPPERATLTEPGTTGTKILVIGYVLSTDCKPIARARVDFWQADDKGEYDNSGYKYRGYQLTDNAGQYRLETVLPGLYPGRTRHIHVKVQAPNQPVITTQIYFPNEAGNARDSIYNPKLLVAMQDTSVGKVATFNFVVNVK